MSLASAGSSVLSSECLVDVVLPGCIPLLVPDVFELIPQTVNESLNRVTDEREDVALRF